MRLTEGQQRMRGGELGAAARVAIEQQIAVGEFFGAERLVPVSGVHMMGDMEVMGEGGFAFVESLLGQGARFSVPVTTNARCVDFERAAAVRQRPELVERERELVANLRALGAIQVDTCINYQPCILARARHRPHGCGTAARPVPRLLDPRHPGGRRPGVDQSRLPGYRVTGRDDE